MAYLVFCVLSEIVQTCYTELEFASLREFTETCTERDEVRSGNRSSQVEHGKGKIVHPTAILTLVHFR